MITPKDVEHIAQLARLQLSQQEKERFQKDLSAILDYFDLLGKINVSKVQATFHPTEGFLRSYGQALRQDQSEKSSFELAEKLVQAAPEQQEKYIKVKAIL